MVRWEPINELVTLQNELSRYMNGVRSGDVRSRDSWLPSADVWETENEIVYAFDLPGIPEDEISVELDDGALTVTAERTREEKGEDGRYYRFERRFGSFTRTIGLPQGVGDDDIKATYDNGVLEVHVAKPEQPQPRKIEISGAKPATIEGNTTEGNGKKHWRH
ncbi:MAG TPA: Hsp20/alpha crystallin family protein [Gaiellaceae bacterium]|nr:Hsp20/alpha crystallin family protein [Gaiellaceae bacterium]